MKTKQTCILVALILVSMVSLPLSSGQEGDSSDKQDTSGDGFFGGLFDTARQTAKTADDAAQQVFGLSPKEEAEVGREIDKSLQANMKVVNNPKIQKRIQKLAQPLLKQCRRDDNPYHFVIVEKDLCNAFASPGNYVYIYTGLLKTHPQDKHLRFVIGHEIGHCELGHAAKRWSAIIRAHQLGGELAANVADGAYAQYLAGYDQEEELDADVWSCKALMKVGGSREDVLEALRLLDKGLDNNASSSESEKPGDEVTRQIDKHFSTHPSADERIKRILQIQP